MSPDVSIILPYYEGSAWLPRSVESVRRQSYERWELLIVDDGSQNSPERIVAEFHDDRIRLLRKPHAGKGAALNAGVESARAKAVCFLDQDDIMLPGRLERQLGALGPSRRVDGVYSDYERRFDSGQFIDRFTSRQAAAQDHLHAMATGRSLLTMQTLMIRKPLLEKVGGFSADPLLTGLDDLEFFVRLLLSEPHLLYAPGAVQCWVQHGRNFSRSDDFQNARLQWLKRLAELAEDHPLLGAEMPYFGFHSRYMRGIHFLETRQPEPAAAEFQKALAFRRVHVNAHYLLLKSLIQRMAVRWRGPASKSKRLS
jgi:glycosyltransferase involved in cell wall biosynthesis